MKALLFVPKIYSIAEMLKCGFKENGCEAKIVDILDIMPRILNNIYVKTAGLPDKIVGKWKRNYYSKLNNNYILEYKKYEPDIVLIYNNQFVYPDTLKFFKRNSKIAFFLGDNPLFSATFKYNLEILKYSDYTICPDSYWRDQLISIGVDSAVLDYIGYDRKIFYKVEKVPNAVFEKFKSDALFIGNGYNGARGYKRSAFYNAISIDSFKLFGNSVWLKTIDDFPELKKHFYLLLNRISNEELNYAINSTKVFPVEQNSGIINGIHMRIFESIGSGVLPIAEWRIDLDNIFGPNLPVIKKYSSINDIIKYYIKNENERIETTKYLQKIVENDYQPEKMIQRLIVS